MGRTKDEVILYLNAVVEEAARTMGGSFRDGCVAIEGALKALQKSGDVVTGFSLAVGPQGVAFDNVEMGELREPGEDLTYEGVWTVIYSLLIPRHSPFFKDPLRPSGLRIAYGDDPMVWYDSKHDNGLPMGLNRPYDESKFDIQGPAAQGTASARA